MSHEPSPRQTDVLRFLAKHQSQLGWMPTIREIGAALGIRSTNGVREHIVALEAKGFVEREAKVARAVRLTRRGTKFVEAMSGVRS